MADLGRIQRKCSVLTDAGFFIQFTALILFHMNIVRSSMKTAVLCAISTQRLVSKLSMNVAFHKFRTLVLCLISYYTFIDVQTNYDHYLADYLPYHTNLRNMVTSTP